jgi:hypothetical protein
MKAYGGVDAYIQVFLSLARVGGERSDSCPSRFTPEKEPRYPSDRRLGGPQSRSGRLGKEKILAFSETQTPTPGLPDRGQPLYRLKGKFKL